VGLPVSLAMADLGPKAGQYCEVFQNSENIDGSFIAIEKVGPSKHAAVN